MTSSQSSIQRTITVTTLAAVALAFFAGGTLVYRTVKERLESDGYESLETVMRFGAERMAMESRRMARHPGEHLDERAVVTEGFEWLILEVGDETVELARTESFPVASRPVDGAWSEPLADDQMRRGILQAPDGARYRVSTLITKPAKDQPPERRGRGRRNGPLGGPPGGPPDGPREGPRGGRREGPPGGPRQLQPEDTFQYFIAAPTADEERVLQGLLRSLALASAVALGAAALMVRWTVHRGLRPVHEISQQISRVTEARLQDPLEIDRVPKELAAIVTSFEGTRAGLADAFVREKRFTADAAHELRTPLAGLRASLEVALRRERSVEEYRRTAEECLEVSTGMEEMVAGLLQLARGGAAPENQEPVPVGTALAKAFGKQGKTMGERGLTLQLHENPDPTITTDRVLLDRILVNVARNAAQHAVPNSTIDAKVASGAECVEVTVSNRAEGLPEDIPERAFDPLWRADPSRGQAAGNSGLGLALVQQCAQALGGTASIEASADQFTIRVSLPGTRSATSA